jgi:HEAT repeat protein
MVDVLRVDRKVSVVAHGFKEMRQEATQIAAECSVPESLQASKELYASTTHQVRMVAVFVLGDIGAKSGEAVRILREKVSTDSSWQVQEILAQAFNQYCKDVGYEASVPTITDWMVDKNPNVRRAATEGLRIWNSKPYFKQHPQEAIRLLARLKGDESEYVRTAVGNAIRDISRNEDRMVKRELDTWNVSEASVAFTHALASRFLK